MHREDVQRNTRPVFEGHRTDGLGGKRQEERCSCVWMARGSCGERKQKPKAKQRQERAFLWHRSGGGVQQSWDMQSARPAGHGWHHGVGEVQVQVLEQQSWGKDRAARWRLCHSEE